LAAALAIVRNVLVKDFTSGGPELAGPAAEGEIFEVHRRTMRRRVTLGAVYRIAPSDGSRRAIVHPARSTNHVRVPSR